MEDTPTNIPKKPRDRSKECKRRLKRVNLDKSYKQLKTVLDRGIEQLMDKSYKTSKDKLSKDDYHSLAMLLKLVKELKLIEEVEKRDV